MRQARRSHCREAHAADRHPQQRLNQCDNLSASSNSEQIHTPPLANLGSVRRAQRTVGGSRESRGSRTTRRPGSVVGGVGPWVHRYPPPGCDSPLSPQSRPFSARLQRSCRSGPDTGLPRQAHDTAPPPPAASTAARRHWQAAGGVAHTVAWPPRLWRADRLLYHY